MTPRFVGVRFDQEMVLLDRTTNSLIHLNEVAVRVWEACGAPDADSDEMSAAGGEVAGAASVRRALAEAGLLRRLDNRYIPVPVEWP